MRDLRDPEALGRQLFKAKEKFLAVGASSSFRQVYDLSKYDAGLVPDYTSNESCIEKYGRANDPSTWR